jgi:hypothetical protein
MHRVGRRFGFRFATGSVFNFTIRTGLADTTTLHTFRLLRFWPCYRSLNGFPFKVRPSVLEGFRSQPSPSVKVSHQWLDGARSQPLLPLAGIQSRAETAHSPECYFLGTRHALEVGLSEFHRVHPVAGRLHRDQFWRGGSRRRRQRLPPFFPEALVLRGQVSLPVADIGLLNHK